MFSFCGIANIANCVSYLHLRILLLQLGKLGTLCPQKSRITFGPPAMTMLLPNEGVPLTVTDALDQLCGDMSEVKAALTLSFCIQIDKTGTADFNLYFFFMSR